MKSHALPCSCHSIAVAFTLAAAPAGLVCAAAEMPDRAPDAPRLEVEAEELVYRYTPADNGAGPMWCHGSTCLVALGDDVFASGLETLPGLKPLNNCRWTLFQRRPGGWTRLQADPAGRTREPCPLAAFPDGRLFLSANPTLTEPNTYAGPARPEVLEFPAAASGGPGRVLQPRWDGSPPFSEHSYRSFAADGPGRELILFQNIGYTHAEWAFYDRSGRWSACGRLKWPWGANYAQPQPVRVCYPNVALRSRAVHFCGVSDIQEPHPEWRAFKKQLTGRDWDYDFRRLFYTWTPDISTGKFADWVEIASRDRTGGWISPGDLWVAPDGAAHLLWTERAIDERLREKFFPGARQSHALHYAVVRQGSVRQRCTLLRAEEGGAREIPGRARFHVTLDHRLYVICHVNGRNAAGQAISENRLMEIQAGGRIGPDVRVPLRRPFTEFFTATVRGGSPPSEVLHLMGIQADLPLAIRYARIRVRP
ncbi:MAG: hypothetical protein JXQ71_12830 [Verrucomicrobia bacterium]|nr:hypothetical protein [Verrucomicrobiota bacterium]